MTYRFMKRSAWLSLACLAIPFALSTQALAAGVSVKMDYTSMATAPFPSDRFTVADWSNKTFRRVSLPKPDCAIRVSDCADIEVLNTLDGFNTQPRITVPFTGDIDVSTVNSNTVYLVNLGDPMHRSGMGQRVGINQVLWDVATKTLVFESDELLNEHTRYLLVVTTGVKDAMGDAIEAGRFERLRREPEEEGRDERDAHQSAGVPRGQIAALSVFTTQTSTADLEKIQHQIKRTRPAKASFDIATAAGATAKAVFPLSSISEIQFNRQTGTAPAFTPSPLPLAALGVVPGAIGRLAFGAFKSPDYLTADKYIPATGTLQGQPKVQGTNELTFELFLPSTPKPAGGYPVAIFGHGFGDSMYGAPWTVASVFASQGIATMAINVVGHAGGSLGTLDVKLANGSVVHVPAGGRGIDQDGNTVIDSTEGVNAAAPRTVLGSRDGLRQQAIDLMQLVRVIQMGVDVEGDGAVDLNPQRIYYSGQSFGGIYGTIFLGVSSDVQVGAPNVPGGSITEVARLGFFRFLSAIALATRTPQLLNALPTPGVPVPFNLNFNENMPLRNLPAVVNTVPGAMAIQTVLENNEWAQQAGNPVSYAPYIRKQPMRGNTPKSVIYQFAKGDTVVPNPTTTAILRAGGLADRATIFRNDLAYAANPAVGKGPHGFISNIGNPAAAPYAIAAQAQIAAFFASHGSVIIDPDGAGPFFETPVNGALPEGLNYIP
jgi:Bacterial Ig-like domain